MKPVKAIKLQDGADAIFSLIKQVGINPSEGPPNDHTIVVELWNGEIIKDTRHAGQIDHQGYVFSKKSTHAVFLEYQGNRINTHTYQI